MSKTTDLAERPKSAVPALASTPALDVDASDIALPKLYKGENQSDFVEDGRAPKGSLFTATGSDDPEPIVLWQPSDGTDADDSGVLFHVLGMRKGKSMTVDGEFQTWAFDDPDAPEDADTTYTYTVYLPEADEVADVPVKLIMSRTSTPCARNINTLLLRHQGKGPLHDLAFRLTTKPREKTAGTKTYKWFVFLARRVEADAANVEAAGRLAELVAGSSIDRPSASSEPAI